MSASERSRQLAATINAMESGAFLQAAEAARLLLAQDPADQDALLLLGMAQAGSGTARIAARTLHRLHLAQPDLPHPGLDAVALLRRAGKPSLIAAQFSACLALAPDDLLFRLKAADQLQADDDAIGALDLLAPVLEGAAPMPEAVLLATIAEANLGRTEAAIARLKDLIRAEPDIAEAWSNLGVLLTIEQRFIEAHAAHDWAVALAPDNPRIRLNQALSLLRAGRMAEAWPGYEQRFADGASPLPLALLLPDIAALGATDGGKTVLLWHEAGFGDTLLFIRYAPLLARRGLHVIAWVPPTLAALIAGVEGVSEVVTDLAHPPAYDWHCPVCSLPRAFGTTLATIPGQVPYLRADPARIAAWARLLPQPGRRLRVGIAWAGQARPWLSGFSALDRRRSLQPGQLTPLAQVRGIDWISLQKDARELPTALAPHDPMPEVRDFADTAAIIAQLDAVVSVDTAIAHLAGGLAKPVLLLDRYDSCWRWFAGRGDSPWYPTLAIYRQASQDHWPPVLQAAADTLARLVEEKAG